MAIGREGRSCGPVVGAAGWSRNKSRLRRQPLKEQGQRTKEIDLEINQYRLNDEGRRKRERAGIATLAKKKEGGNGGAGSSEHSAKKE